MDYPFELKPAASFDLVRFHRIDSLDLDVAEYRHRITGAQHFHLATDNAENVFLVAFRTVPASSSGVAHILEHTTLCGSERYPVRDPFFMMHRRSLNTFMNAFTSSDYTAYPFASLNRNDFNNLMDIYLDAVFFARLDPLDFQQEGHRIEFATPDDPSTPLVYRGVVYNEMKGDTSSPVSLVYDALKSYLFPTTTYHYNSGGDPAQIPDLDYAELMTFYRRHYHPSNSVFMTFGDIPAATHQDRFEQNALCKFKRSEDEINIVREKRLQAPLRVEQAYAFDGEDGVLEPRDKTHIVLAWLLGPNTDLECLLKAHLMADVLLDNSASVLRNVLETTDLGQAVSSLCGLEESNHEISFFCGLESSNPEHADAVEALILATLEKVAREGVPQQQLEAVLHQLELHQREIGGDGHPYGLQLLMAALPAAIHRGDAIGLLDLDMVLEELREEIRQPGFIANLVQTQLLDNQHRVRLTMRPDSKLAARQMKAEQDELARLKSDLSDDDKRSIVDNAARLAQRQAAADDPDLLPKVGLSDIPAERHMPSAVIRELHDGSRLHYYHQGTNGLVYQQIITALPSIPDHLLPYLPVYANVVSEIGSAGRGYQETQQLQHQLTGGISVFPSLRCRSESSDEVLGFLTVSGKALRRNGVDLARLLADTLHRVDFSERHRIRELVQQSRAQRDAGLVRSGHVFAMSAAASGLGPVLQINHRLTGMAGILSFRSLEQSLADEKQLDKVCEYLAELTSLLTQNSRAHLVISDDESVSDCVSQLEATMVAAGSADESRFSVSFEPQQLKQLWVTNSQVNFCAKAYPCVPEDHEDAAALRILGGVLTNGFLHRVIREKGGAYGGGAGYDSSNGVFRFYSYRDPRLQATLDDFDASIAWLLAEKPGMDKVEEAILGVISGIDAPASPAGEARQAFHSSLFGRSAEKINRYRQSIIQVTSEAVRDVAERYIRSETASTAVIAGRATADAMEDKADFDVFYI